MDGTYTKVPAQLLVFDSTVMLRLLVVRPGTVSFVRRTAGSSSTPPGPAQVGVMGLVSVPTYIDTVLANGRNLRLERLFLLLERLGRELPRLLVPLVPLVPLVLVLQAGRRRLELFVIGAADTGIPRAGPRRRRPNNLVVVAAAVRGTAVMGTRNSTIARHLALA